MYINLSAIVLSFRSLNFSSFIREEELDARLDIKSEEQFPKVVMAPNAAEYFEKLEMEKAIAESQRTASLAG